jgi:F-type H+-transporting ATPase subunit a
MKEIDEPLNWILLIAHRLENPTIVHFLETWESFIFAFIVAVLVTSFLCWGARKRELIPCGIQNLLEYAVESLQGIVISILGEGGKKYFPFLGSLFIYIFTMNIFGLIPMMRSPSANINITAAHAICVFLLVQYLSLKQMGISGFLFHLAGSPKTLLQWLLVPLILPIELITQISRPITLAFRLFGNIFGEDIMIGYFILAGLTLIPAIYPIPIPLQTPFLFLALLTSFMQALVFTLLTTVYILLSIPEEHAHH